MCCVHPCQSPLLFKPSLGFQSVCLYETKGLLGTHYKEQILLFVIGGIQQHPIESRIVPVFCMPTQLPIQVFCRQKVQTFWVIQRN